MGNGLDRYRHPEIIPNFEEEPTFDKSFGFPEGRKERVMVATEEEMKAAKLPLVDRDFCAHHLLKYRKCRRDVFPLLYKCHHEKHSYLNCQHDDYVLRLKEYEREKRLRMRQERIANIN